jgi:hypothetical protein
VLVDHTAAKGPGRTLVTHRLGRHLYVMPAVAEPYVGRFLDQQLFDVASLRRARTATGRVPVRIGYRGATPAVPGVRITSAAKGVARGYLTAGSSAAFGRALAAQWKADEKAGWPDRTTLFSGVTKINLEASGAGPVTPKFPMYTLVVKAIGADGKPQPAGFYGLINVDDARAYVGFVAVADGEARVSVPKGTYSLIGDDFAFDDATETADLRITVVDAYQVTRAGQTLTVDHRRATTTPTVKVPRKATETDALVSVDRGDAAGNGGFGSSYFLDPRVRVHLSPAAKPTKGTFALTQAWNLQEPGSSTPAYAYNLGRADDRIPADLRTTFTAAQLGVVSSAYYGDGSAPDGAFLRYPTFGDSGGGGTLSPVRRATVRTEYVGARGSNAAWTDVALVNNEAFDDPGFLDGPTRRIAAGSYRTERWFRGPLGAAVPIQSGAGFCYGCRSGNVLSVALAPFTDSNLRHSGEIFAAPDELPVARFRLYRNGTLLSDEDDALGGDVTVPAGKATYKAVLDVDRRQQAPAQSTRSHTELTFVSAAGAGPKLPGTWYCDGDDCRVLPLVQARVALPTDLQGRLPASRSKVTVTVAQAQLAATSPATSATLEVRAPGDLWTAVSLRALGNGTYEGVVDNRGLDGADVDVRVTGADRAGSSFTQTVLKAYTVVGS